jgi:hypothetical protein
MLTQFRQLCRVVSRRLADARPNLDYIVAAKYHIICAVVAE